MAIDINYNDPPEPPPPSPKEQFWKAVNYADTLDVAYWVRTHNIDLNEANEEGYTPLLLASRNDNTEKVKALIEGGANPHVMHSDQYTILMRAAGKGNLELCRWLVENTDININAQDKDGDTALSESIYHKHPDTFSYLFDQGADPYILNHDGKNVWDWAKKTEAAPIMGLVHKTMYPSHDGYTKIDHHSVQSQEKTPQGVTLSHVFNFQVQTLTSVTQDEDNNIHNVETKKFAHVPKRTLSKAQNALQTINKRTSP